MSSSVQNNSTTAAPAVATAPSSTSFQVLCGIGIAGGMLVMFFGLLTVGTILGTKELRKRREYILIAGLLSGDTLIGGMNLASSAVNLYAATTNTPILVLPVVLLLLPSNCFGVIGNITTSIFLLAISVDRFISVISPSAYLDLGRKYFVFITGTPITVVAIMFAAMFISSALTKPWVANISIAAAAPAAYPTQFDLTSRICVLIGSCFSVIIYAVIMVVMLNTRKSKLDKIKEAQIKRQRKITKILCLMMVWTVCTFDLPMAFAAWASLGGSTFPGDAATKQFLFVVAGKCWLAHALFNILIFLFRAEDVRAKIIANRFHWLLLKRSANQVQSWAHPSNKNKSTGSDYGSMAPPL